MLSAFALYLQDVSRKIVPFVEMHRFNDLDLYTTAIDEHGPDRLILLIELSDLVAGKTHRTSHARTSIGFTPESRCFDDLPPTDSVVRSGLLCRRRLRRLP